MKAQIDKLNDWVDYADNFGDHKLVVPIDRAIEAINMIWQPAETAPKDGTEIIIYDTDTESQYMASWCKSMGNGCWNIGMIPYIPMGVTHWHHKQENPK